MENSNSNSIMQKVWTISSWIFTIFFLLLSMSSLGKNRSMLTFAAFLLMALLICPPISTFLKTRLHFLKNKYAKAGLLFALLILAFIGSPRPPGKPKVETVQNEQRAAEAEKEEEAEGPDDLSKENTIYFDADGNKISKPEKVKDERQIWLKTFTSYNVNPYTKAGYQHIKTYYFGLYIHLTGDTTGAARKIMSYLEVKANEANDNDAIHLWVFSDSTVIPKSFEEGWSTPKISKKCYAHALRATNGKFLYDYDIFGEFER